MTQRENEIDVVQLILRGLRFFKRNKKSIFFSFLIFISIGLVGFFRAKKNTELIYEKQVIIDSPVVDGLILEEILLGVSSNINRNGFSNVIFNNKLGLSKETLEQVDYISVSLINKDEPTDLVKLCIGVKNANIADSVMSSLINYLNNHEYLKNKCRRLFDYYILSFKPVNGAVKDKILNQQVNSLLVEGEKKSLKVFEMDDHDVFSFLLANSNSNFSKTVELIDQRDLVQVNGFIVSKQIGKIIIFGAVGIVSGAVLGFALEFYKKIKKLV